MRVEVLYFQGCPNHVPTVDRVRRVLADEGVSVDIEQIEVADVITAESLAFLGSPTVRVNGRDVEESAAVTGIIGLTCRMYMSDGVREGVPPADAIRRAVRDASAKRQRR